MRQGLFLLMFLHSIPQTLETWESAGDKKHIQANDPANQRSEAVIPRGPVDRTYTLRPIVHLRVKGP